LKTVTLDEIANLAYDIVRVSKVATPSAWQASGDVAGRFRQLLQVAWPC
jgi:hypothetical protein